MVSPSFLGMADAQELTEEQAYFDRAWECREATRHSAESARGEGHRYDGKAIVQQNKDYAEQLAGPDVAVAHGAIALEDGEVLYIGRNSIWDESRDILVVNWRTEIGELYERATVQDTCGVARKRTFKTDRNRILDFEDAVFADLASRVAELSDLEISGVDDALLDDLDTGRTGAMRDIVRTIQASQSGLIRHPADALLLVQGGPGTGKSAVALHRASWLLFNESGLRPERMLVVGPSETFTNYIKDVLPGLGDAQVPQTNLRRLGPQKSSRREESPETARLKGEERMAGLLERALHLRIRLAGNDPELVIGTGWPRLAIPRAELETQLDALRKMPSYAAGRTAMRTWLTQRATELLVEESEFVRTVEVDQQAVDQALERIWPQLSAQQFLRDLLGSQARLQEAAGDAFTAGDIGRLHRQSAGNLAAETWSDTDVALLDEADYLIRRTTDRYDHIVLDEAQDLSPMQLRSIRRRSSNGRYTVVGDIAQSTGPWARDTWDDVVEGLRKDAPVVYEELDYGYRVPREIYEIAAKLLPLMAPELTPLTVVRPAPEPPAFILDDGDHDLAEETVTAIEEHAVKGRFIGVVVAPEYKADLAEELSRRGINFADADKGSLGASVNLISATEAKGLEFDAVVVVEPAAIADIGDKGLRLLYIALTRATKYLTVVHARAFEPLGLEGAPAQAAPEPTYTERLFLGATEATRTVPRPSSRTSIQDSLLEVVPVVTGERPDVSGTSTTNGALSPLLVGAARGIADQIRDDVHPDKWPALLEEITRQLTQHQHPRS